MVKIIDQWLLKRKKNTLAENAGLDVIDTLMGLRKAHTQKGRNPHAGLDAYTGKVVNMKSRNVVEPLRVKTQALSSATDVATMILRIDDIIVSKILFYGFIIMQFKII